MAPERCFNQDRGYSIAAFVAPWSHCQGGRSKTVCSPSVGLSDVEDNKLAVLLVNDALDPRFRDHDLLQMACTLMSTC